MWSREIQHDSPDFDRGVVRETSGTVVEIGRTREASATFVWEQPTFENDAAIDHEGDQVVVIDCVSQAMERKS